LKAYVARPRCHPS